VKTVAVGIDGAETRRMAQDERTTRRCVAMRLRWLSGAEWRVRRRTTALVNGLI